VEVSRVPGLFQTPEYARVIFDANAEFREITSTTDAASGSSSVRPPCTTARAPWR
jgi:hypothetical protein